MLVDLHSHTFPCSPCSKMSADDLIQSAMVRGLDAICVTDHLNIQGGREAQALARRRYGFPVFRGVEARTTMGDILVFGLDEDYPEGIEGGELLEHVDRAGGASVLAHPFRHGGGWALWYWLQCNGLALSDELRSVPELALVHAVETYNGHVNRHELAQAEELARILALPVTGGSDAHEPDAVGVTATEFAAEIRDESDLVREIRAGQIRPRRLGDVPSRLQWERSQTRPGDRLVDHLVFGKEPGCK